ncbi:hypothetical protein ACFFLM_21270 [Deinococcus oregonensis]|uniref:Methyl-accepting chemotaxis protein n=1 Tax=Deinococcus oregonensis TaxID=1805970 RepID=A0ABV6B7U9_9DEIO
MDYLGVGSLITGVVKDVGSAVNPYFFTDQEKSEHALAQGQIDAQMQATALQGQSIAVREATNQKAITYGLAAVLGVSCVFLASRLIGK